MINYIALQDCIDGGLYRVDARNFGLGIFIADDKGFIGIRHKFGLKFLDTEFHWDTGAPHGTASPLELLEVTDFKSGLTYSDQICSEITSFLEAKIEEYRKPQ